MSARIVEIYEPWEKPGGITRENVERVVKKVMRKIEKWIRADLAAREEAKKKRGTIW